MITKMQLFHSWIINKIQYNWIICKWINELNTTYRQIYFFVKLLINEHFKIVNKWSEN